MDDIDIHGIDIDAEVANQDVDDVDLYGERTVEDETETNIIFKKNYQLKQQKKKKKKTKSL